MIQPFILMFAKLNISPNKLTSPLNYKICWLILIILFDDCVNTQLNTQTMCRVNRELVKLYCFVMDMSDHHDKLYNDYTEYNLDFS